MIILYHVLTETYGYQLLILVVQSNWYHHFLLFLYTHHMNPISAEKEILVPKLVVGVMVVVVMVVDVVVVVMVVVMVVVDVVIVILMVVFLVNVEVYSSLYN